MNSVFIGTTNKGKVNDFKHLFNKHGIHVNSLLDLPEIIDVEETGKTFAENARLKAEFISRRLGEIVIADDSGLVVDALNGMPGVYSARYAGEEKNDEENLRKVLEEMNGIPWENRTARFVCVLAVAVPGRDTFYFEGQCSGYIAEKPSGEYGFGYDPIFYLPEKAKTMAELNPEEKNNVSHRRKAMEKLEKEWDNIFGLPSNKACAFSHSEKNTDCNNIADVQHKKTEGCAERPRFDSLKKVKTTRHYLYALF